MSVHFASKQGKMDVKLAAVTENSVNYS